MELTNREFWALIHWIVLGGAFLVAFTGGLAGFYGRLRRMTRWASSRGIVSK
jgi:hypothetical protein